MSFTGRMVVVGAVFSTVFSFPFYRRERAPHAGVEAGFQDSVLFGYR
jgi:hypothetical protein